MNLPTDLTKMNRTAFLEHVVSIYGAAPSAIYIDGPNSGWGGQKPNRVKYKLAFYYGYNTLPAEKAAVWLMSNDNPRRDEIEKAYALESRGQRGAYVSLIVYFKGRAGAAKKAVPQPVEVKPEPYHMPRNMAFTAGDVLACTDDVVHAIAKHALEALSESAVIMWEDAPDEMKVPTEQHVRQMAIDYAGDMLSDLAALVVQQLAKHPFKFKVTVERKLTVVENEVG